MSATTQPTELVFVTAGDDHLGPGFCKAGRHGEPQSLAAACDQSNTTREIEEFAGHLFLTSLCFFRSAQDVTITEPPTPELETG